MKILMFNTVKVVLVMFLLSASMNAFSQESSAGLITKEYNIDSFNKINIGGAFDIDLIKGDAPKVKVTANEKTLEKILVEVNDGILKVSFKSNTLKTDNKVKVQITFTEINSINISGASNLSGSSLIEVAELKIKSSGASDITLELKAE